MTQRLAAEVSAVIPDADLFGTESRIQLPDRYIRPDMEKLLIRAAPGLILGLTVLCAVFIIYLHITAFPDRAQIGVLEFLPGLSQFHCLQIGGLEGGLFRI